MEGEGELWVVGIKQDGKYKFWWNDITCTSLIEFRIISSWVGTLIIGPQLKLTHIEACELQASYIVQNSFIYGI